MKKALFFYAITGFEKMDCRKYYYQAITHLT